MKLSFLYFSNSNILVNRLNKEKIGHIKKLINNNVSIREISRTLKIPLSTSHYNVRKISENYRKLVKVNIKIPDMEALGEILGIFAGDGSCSKEKYMIRISLSKTEYDYAKYIQSLFLNCFGKKYSLFQYDGVTIVQIKSKIIYNFLLKYLSWKRSKTYSIHLKRRIKNKKFGKGFLRGNFDTDGNIDDWNGYKRLTLATNSKQLTEDIKFYLKLINVSFYIRKYGKEIRIRIDKKNAIKFINNVGIHNNRYKFLKGE